MYFYDKNKLSPTDQKGNNYKQMSFKCNPICGWEKIELQFGKIVDTLVWSRERLIEEPICDLLNIFRHRIACA